MKKQLSAWRLVFFIIMGLVTQVASGRAAELASVNNDGVQGNHDSWIFHDPKVQKKN